MLKKSYFNWMVAVAFLFLFSCSKYEEGPFFSLATKKARLTERWRLIEMNEKPVANNVVWIFEKDGNFKIEYNNTPNNNPAKWNFEESKSKISIYYEQDDITNYFIIIRMTSNELWLDQENGSNYIRLKFEKEK